MWNLTPFPGYRSCDDCWSPGRHVCEFDYLPAATTGLILTNCSLNVSADTPPPAYMPPDEQLGQESQSMETSSSLVQPNMARGGEEFTQLHWQYSYVQKIQSTPQWKQGSPVWRLNVNPRSGTLLYSIVIEARWKMFSIWAHFVLAAQWNALLTMQICRSETRIVFVFIQLYLGLL